MKTPSVSKKFSQLYLNREVYRHCLVLDTSISRNRCKTFFLGTEEIYVYKFAFLATLSARKQYKVFNLDRGKNANLIHIIFLTKINFFLLIGIFCSISS